VQCPLTRIATRQGKRHSEPAFGVGVIGAGVAECAERIRPAAPDSGALFHQTRDNPVGQLLELLEECAHGFRSLGHTVDALPLGLLDEVSSSTGAEFSVVGLGDEAFCDRVALVEPVDECLRDGFGRVQIDASEALHQPAQSGTPTVCVRVPERSRWSG
jgi:hypothetical protein